MLTQSQETLNSVLEPGTIKLLGDRTLLKLQKAEITPTLPSGLVNPLFENYETDGGRKSSRISNNKWLSIGTVLATNHSELKAGDTVTVLRSVLNSADDYFFPLDRSQLAISFDGTVLVPNSMLESKVNGN